jgi:predicted dienelactone hydrolase
MAYDPFRRGPLPVGVRSVSLADEARAGRLLPVEIWYPAEDAYAGQDVAEDSCDRYEVIPGFPAQPQDAVRDARARGGRWPLIVFSHGYGGHRRQSTFLCTHLASHGYVVAAADHAGNTVLDGVQAMMAGRQPDPLAVLREFVVLRPADVGFAIDRLLGGGADGVDALCDETRVAMCGHSFGGWTTLAVTGRDPRIRAALALAPAGGTTVLGTEVLQESLDLAWERAVPTLFVVADQDSLLPLQGMRELHARTPGPARMVVLRDADHLHFCDDVERVHELFRMMPVEPLFADIAPHIKPIGELCPGAHAHDVVRGLGLAHFDAVLKADDAAAGFLAGDVAALMAARGVRVDVHG